MNRFFVYCIVSCMLLPACGKSKKVEETPHTIIKVSVGQTEATLARLSWGAESATAAVQVTGATFQIPTADLPTTVKFDLLSKGQSLIRTALNAKQRLPYLEANGCQLGYADLVTSVQEGRQILELKVEVWADGTVNGNDCQRRAEHDIIFGFTSYPTEETQVEFACLSYLDEQTPLYAYWVTVPESGEGKSLDVPIVGVGEQRCACMLSSGVNCVSVEAEDGFVGGNNFFVGRRQLTRDDILWLDESPDVNQSKDLLHFYLDQNGQIVEPQTEPAPTTCVEQETGSVEVVALSYGLFSTQMTLYHTYNQGIWQSSQMLVEGSNRQRVIFQGVHRSNGVPVYGLNLIDPGTGAKVFQRDQITDILLLVKTEADPDYVQLVDYITDDLAHAIDSCFRTVINPVQATFEFVPTQQVEGPLFVLRHNLDLSTKQVVGQMQDVDGVWTLVVDDFTPGKHELTFCSYGQCYEGTVSINGVTLSSQHRVQYILPVNQPSPPYVVWTEVAKSYFFQINSEGAVTGIDGGWLEVQ